MLASCSFCERRCAVDRTREVGACGVGSESNAYLEDLLWGEEQFITPSYALFFSGCNFRCAFCYATEYNRRPGEGRRVEPEAVAARVQALPERPTSFSFIGGEPTCHLPTALRVMAALPPDLPVVWNSNFFFTPEAAKLLAGAVGVFVADLHFGNDVCAAAIAGVSPYLEVVARNLRWARERGELLVRLLAVPGHVECCLGPSLAWLAAEMKETPVHLLTNYLPPSTHLIEGVECQHCGDRDSGLDRYLTEGEAARARELVIASGLAQVE
jgi:putative pyruvate formate lyase activating enzyme